MFPSLVCLCPRMLLEDLPDELLLNILSYLTPHELLTCCRPVNKRFHRLTSDNMVWKEQVLRSCFIKGRRSYCPGALASQPVCWKSVYEKGYRVDRLWRSGRATRRTSFQAHSSFVARVGVSAQAGLVGSLCFPETSLRLFDLATSAFVRGYAIEYGNDMALEGNLLVYSDYDQVHVMDLRGGAAMRLRAGVASGEEDNFVCCLLLLLDMSADGGGGGAPWLYAGCGHGVFGGWDLRRADVPLLPFVSDRPSTGIVAAMCATTDHLVTASNELSIWRRADGALVRQNVRLSELCGLVDSVEAKGEESLFTCSSGEVYRWDWKSLELQNARLSDVPMNLYQSAFRMRQVREASLYRAQNSGPPVQNVGFLASFRAIRAFEVPDGRAPLVPLYQLSFDSDVLCMAIDNWSSEVMVCGHDDGSCTILSFSLNS